MLPEKHLLLCGNPLVKFSLMRNSHLRTAQRRAQALCVVSPQNARKYYRAAGLVVEEPVVNDVSTANSQHVQSIENGILFHILRSAKIL